MSLVLPIVGNLVLTGAALGYGSLLKPALSSKLTTLEQLVLTLTCGLGIVGTLLYDIGQFSYSRATILLLLAPGIILLWKPALPFFRQCYAEWRPVRPPVLPALAIAAVLAVTALGGFAAPTGDMEHDAIAYHFLGPKVWLREGIIRPVVDQSYTNFPAIVEASYGPLMLMGGEKGPELFAVTGMVSILLVSASLAIRLGAGVRGAWWCAALVATMPAIYHGTFGGFIDAVYGSFVLSAARVGFDAERTGEYALFGLLCGFAIATKYTGLIALALLIGLTFLVSVLVRPSDIWRIMRGAVIASGVAAATGCAVYIRNWILLGCPIYPPPPGLPRFFHVKYMPPSAIDWFHRYVFLHGRGMGRSLSSFLLLPYNLTYHTANFNGAGGIGLAPLALAPLGVLALRRNAFAAGLALFAFFSTVAWFLTAQESRYLVPVYGIAAVFAVTGWKYAATMAPRFGPVLAGLVVACSVLYGLFMVGSARTEDVRAAMSPAYAEKRAVEEIPFRDSFQYLNHDPSVTKILVLAPLFPGYYFAKDYVKPIGAVGEESVPDAGNLQAVLAEAPSLGVSHVLDVRRKGASFEIPDHQTGLTLIFENADQRIYRVKR